MLYDPLLFSFTTCFLLHWPPWYSKNTQCMFYPQAFVEFVILFETHLAVHMIASVQDLFKNTINEFYPDHSGFYTAPTLHLITKVKETIGLATFFSF